MKTLVEKRQRLAFGAFIGFFLTDQNFNLTGEQAADGRAALGGEDLGLSKCLSIKTDCEVLFHVIIRAPFPKKNTYTTCNTQIAWCQQCIRLGIL